MSRRQTVPGMFSDATEPFASRDHERVYEILGRSIEATGLEQFLAAARAATASVRQEGVVLRGDPLDVDWVPRVVPSIEFELLRRGIEQRLLALRAFVAAWMQGRERVVPDELLPPPRCTGTVTLHIYAPDLVRDAAGRLLVLEDNLGHPAAQIYSSLVRDHQERRFPMLFDALDVRSRPDFPGRLGEICRSLAGEREGELVYLWPGAAATSEAFEVARVVQGSGMTLATPGELRLDGSGGLTVGTPPRRVAAVHVRLPEANPYNRLLEDVAMHDRTRILSPHHQRVAADKAVHAFVPDLIRHYLEEEPLLGQPETRWLGIRRDRLEVLADLTPWVLKRRHGVGGHQVRFGRELTGDEAAPWVAAMKQQPQDFVAQRVVEPSTHVCLVDDYSVAVRPIDLRLYALADDEHVEVMPLGLTRRTGEHTDRSNLANPGTAIKDTWIEREGGFSAAPA